MKSEHQRFMDKVSPEPNSGCWLWVGGVASSGYGMFWRGGKVDTAPRQSYRMFCGEITDDLHIMHKCDVRLCVNPDHLSLGTNADNVADKTHKGRAAKKLTPEQVLLMRTMPTVSKRKLAKEFDVDRRMVQFILRGKNWSHI
jgi:hypothetical protein